MFFFFYSRSLPISLLHIWREWSFDADRGVHKCCNLKQWIVFFVCMKRTGNGEHNVIEWHFLVIACCFDQLLLSLHRCDKWAEMSSFATVSVSANVFEKVRIRYMFKIKIESASLSYCKQTHFSLSPCAPAPFNQFLAIILYNR